MKPFRKNRRFSMSTGARFSSNISAQFGTALCASNIPSSCWSIRNIFFKQSPSQRFLNYTYTHVPWQRNQLNIVWHCSHTLSIISTSKSMSGNTRPCYQQCLPPNKKDTDLFLVQVILLLFFSLKVLTFKFHGYLRDPITPLCQLLF